LRAVLASFGEEVRRKKKLLESSIKDPGLAGGGAGVGGISKFDDGVR